jgi:DNA-directed RNA polymerase specialized sigma24 family protein
VNRVDDQAVLKRVLSGEVEAYEALYRKYRLVVHALALARLRDRRQAGELERQVFLRAYDRLGTLSHPVPRFLDVLVGLTEEACRERILETTAWILKVPPEAASRATAALDLERVLGGLPEEHAGLILAEQAVGIPVQYEIPFLLRFLEGLDYPAIARILDVPISEVESLVDRGRRLHERELRFHLEKLAGRAS